jgi:hypothetical protein
MTRALVCLLALPLVLGAADVTGKWIFEVRLPVGSGSPTFTFRQDGETLTGRYSGALGEADVTGTVQGDEIRFQFTVKGDLGELTAKYTGKVSGDAMKGRADYGPAVGEGTFEGKRQK